MKEREAPKPSRTKVSKEAADWVDKIYGVGKKVNEKRAKSAIGRKIREGIDPEMLLEKYQQYTECNRNKEARFVQAASPWFNGERWKDDPSAWVDSDKPEVATPSNDMPDDSYFDAKTMEQVNVFVGRDVPDEFKGNPAYRSMTKKELISAKKQGGV